CHREPGHAGGPMTTAILPRTAVAARSYARGVSAGLRRELRELRRSPDRLMALVAAPSSFPAVIAGRILAVTAVSMLGFAESWAVAALVGVRVAIVHPGVFVGALVVTAFATACSALALAALFVRTRAARAFQNTLTYPFYILGGVMVDRKSTRLNSSHVNISYAVFC